MDSKFQTSFIPKKTYDGGSRPKSPLSILYIVSVLITVLAVLVSGGMFAYKVILDKKIAEQKIELSAKQAGISDAAIREVQKVDNKLKASTSLLNVHSAVSEVFSLLEKNTLQNLSFSSFDFSYAGPNKIAVSMKGKAKNFGVVARQQERFVSVAGKNSFKTPLFSNLDTDSSGNVVFTFLTSLDPSVIQFKSPTAAPVVAPAPVVEQVASTTLNKKQ